FDVYARNPTTKMLELAMKSIDEPAFTQAVCDAATKIGDKMQGKSPQVAEAMKKVLEKSTDEAVKNKAKIVLDRQ
ncbi:MAG: hypothetical protein ACRCUY_13970, partial [Thermoguttaceae bacterium]